MARTESSSSTGSPRDDDDSVLSYTVRNAGPGLLGAAILAVGAIGIGWIPPRYDISAIPGLDLLRSDVGTWFSRGAVIVGGALILQAWLILGLRVMRGQVPDVRRLWAIFAVWCVPLLAVPPLFSRDVYSYYAQGRLVLSGADPYTNGVGILPGWFLDGVDPQWAQTPAPYGPLFLSLSRGVASLVGDNPYLGALCFRAMALAGVALLAYFLPRLAFHCGINGSKALWLGAMNPLVLMLFVVADHNDALMIGLVVAGLVYMAESRPISGILLITAAIAIKPTAVLALPFAALLWAGSNATMRKRVMAWIQVGVISVLAFLGLSAVIGTGFGWIGALAAPGAVKSWLSPPTALGMTINGISQHIGLGDHFDLIISAVRALTAVAAVAIVAWLCLKPEGRTPVRSLMLALLTVALLGPTLQTWYLLWILPLAAASGLSTKALRATMLAIAGVTVYTLCDPALAVGIYTDFNNILAMVAAIGAVVAVMLFSRRERSLIVGDTVAHGLIPEDAPARARHESLVVRPAAGS